MWGFERHIFFFTFKRSIHLSRNRPLDFLFGRVSEAEEGGENKHYLKKSKLTWPPQCPMWSKVLAARRIRYQKRKNATGSSQGAFSAGICCAVARGYQKRICVKLLFEYGLDNGGYKSKFFLFLSKLPRNSRIICREPLISLLDEDCSFNLCISLKASVRDTSFKTICLTFVGTFLVCWFGFTYTLSSFYLSLCESFFFSPCFGITTQPRSPLLHDK